MIRVASTSDLAALIEFLRRDWKSNHVFVTHPELLEWQHVQGESLNFVLGLGDKGIGAVLGFIPLARFDADLRSYNDISLALWKRSDRDGSPGLGIQVFTYVLSVLRPRIVIAIGLTDNVRALYTALRFRVGVCDHFVLRNPDKMSPRLLSGDLLPLPKSDRAIGNVALEPFDVDFLSQPGAIPERLFERSEPRKSLVYVLNRYVRHPYYTYRTYAIGSRSVARALLVARIVDAQGARAFRIVDLIGDENAFAECGPALTAELRRLDCEYADIVCAGVSHAALNAAGFIDRRTRPELVVPMHFEPFEQRNVDLNYGIRDAAGVGNVRVLRGDGDQDRPNKLPVAAPD